MFEYCTDPDVLSTFEWFSCYLTNGKHLLFYKSFGLIILLLFITAPLAALLGLLAAVAIKSKFFLLRLFSKAYANIVRGIPDIIFFLFIPITIDQLIEIVSDFPNINNTYKNDRVIINIEKSSNKFIKRVSIKSEELNLSINVMNCKFNEINKKYFKHFNFEEYSG